MAVGFISKEYQRFGMAESGKLKRDWPSADGEEKPLKGSVLPCLHFEGKGAPEARLLILDFKFWMGWPLRGNVEFWIGD
jgi:hypothetical protein